MLVHLANDLMIYFHHFYCCISIFAKYSTGLKLRFKSNKKLVQHSTTWPQMFYHTSMSAGLVLRCIFR